MPKRNRAGVEALDVDIAIIGAGMAGASLAAAIGGDTRVALIEGEAAPGYHATGRSAAFWMESYGGPAVQPLTTASYPLLEQAGVLRRRGVLHVADAAALPALDALAESFADRPVALEPVTGAEIGRHVPLLAPGIVAALWEPSCCDIDVARLHARQLAMARGQGATLVANAPVRALSRSGGRWTIAAGAWRITARLVVNAAGAWATEVARLAGAAPIAITPHRRTIVQLAVEPAPDPDLPVVLDALGRFYWKPEPGGRLWLSPHDETAVAPQDVQPEEWDVAVAIDRFEQATRWRVVRRERAWAGLRSFAPDRVPVYGFDPVAPGFFWCAGQGGFGIQTAPAAALLAAGLLLGRAPAAAVADIDPQRFSPGRF